MDWSQTISALIGGFFALAGVALTQSWLERSRRAGLLDEAVLECRASGMEAAALIEAGAMDRATEVLPRFQRHVITVQVLLQRARFKGRVKAGFAQTFHELSGNLAKLSADDITKSGTRVKYVAAVYLLVHACVAWEAQPARYRAGNLSAALRSEADEAGPS